MPATIQGYNSLFFGHILYLTLSLTRVPCGTKDHYMLNIWSIFIKQHKSIVQICLLKA